MYSVPFGICLMVVWKWSPKANKGSLKNFCRRFATPGCGETYRTRRSYGERQRINSGDLRSPAECRSFE